MLMSTAMKNYVLGSAATNGSIREALTLGRLYIFSGPVPEHADDLLDMVNEHTELVEMTEDGDGSTGLSFGDAAAGALPKDSAVWEGPITFDGFDDAPGTKSPTFIRFCESGDDGRGVATTQKRVQMTCNPTGAAEVYCPALTDNGLGTNIRGFGTFFIRFLDITF